MSATVRAAAVIAAAGAGTRFRHPAAPAAAASGSAPPPKTFLRLAGRPLFLHAAEALLSCEEIAAVAVAVPAGWVAAAREECRALARVTAVVPGGQRRQDSVLNALRALAPVRPEVVAVHDGARPLATPDLIRRCLASAAARGSGVAALPVTDTLKRADPEGQVVGTLDRAGLWAMQTPQVFRFDLLLAAHEAAQAGGYELTDDAALVERLGEPVWLVPGEETNVKVTTPGDLAIVEGLLGRRDPVSPVRVGHGFDAHRLEAGRPCLLGGVAIPHHAGPAGHSDADVVTHAIMDAVLGALALGDIGRHFPDTDPEYAGISSLDLAARVTRLAAEAGYRVAGIDATVIAQAPRIAPHVPAMRERLAAAFDCPVDAVSVKGTTTEGLGFPGRGEGLAVHAVAVLVRA